MNVGVGVGTGAQVKDASGVEFAELKALVLEILSEVQAIVARNEREMPWPRVLRPQRVAKMLDCSTATVKRMIADGKVHSVRIGEQDHIPFTEIVRITSVGKRVRRPAPASDLKLTAPLPIRR